MLTNGRFISAHIYDAGIDPRMFFEKLSIAAFLIILLIPTKHFDLFWLYCVRNFGKDNLSIIELVLPISFSLIIFLYSFIPLSILVGIFNPL